MVSLWGSKNGEDQNEGEDRASIEGDNSRQPSRHGDGGRGRNPDERTRLLPPRNDGYLDPDDPAVSTQTLASRHQANDSCPGLAIQPLDRQSSTLHLRPLPCHQLPLVGAPAGLHIRQPAHDALPRVRLLRLLLYHAHSGEPAHCHTILHRTIQAHGNPHSHCLGIPTHRHDYHSCRL